MENMRMFAVMRDRHMRLAQVNPCYLLALGLCYWLLLLIGSYGFVLRPCPMDYHGLRQAPCPIQDERCVATTSGQTELAIPGAHSLTSVLETEEPLPPARGVFISIVRFPA